VFIPGDVWASRGRLSAGFWFLRSSTPGEEMLMRECFFFLAHATSADERERGFLWLLAPETLALSILSFGLCSTPGLPNSLLWLCDGFGFERTLPPSFLGEAGPGLVGVFSHFFFFFFVRCVHGQNERIPGFD
jgi:hypothetical protein